MSRTVQLSLVFALALLGGLAATSRVYAQANPAGIAIDPAGVLRVNFFRDPTGALTRARMEEAREVLAGEILRPSELRKISLTRLEAALARSIEAGEGVPDEMKYLAGLTEIQYVFYYPETKDIVIAGPAEGFFRDISGRVIGMNTGRSVLDLDDLVVALRAYGPSGKRTGVIGCSIDPTQDGLQRMQQFLQQVSLNMRRMGRAPTPAEVQQLVGGLQKSLGKQTVRIDGVSPKTHFAQVMVEADYRMKLIGIGLENPAAKIPSYVSQANPSSVARNALLRWYFVPNYECVKVSEDELAMQLVGDGVKLVGQDEMVKADGVRVGGGNVDRAGQAFVNTFTAQYPNLARTTPVYAQLKNLVDMAIAAAFIQDRDWYAKAGWNMTFLGDERAYPVETGIAPKQVDTAVNAIWKGNTLMTPIGGGVTINAREALYSERLLDDEGGAVAKTHASLDLKRLPAAQWWWD